MKYWLWLVVGLIISFAIVTVVQVFAYYVDGAFISSGDMGYILGLSVMANYLADKFERN